MLVDWLNDGRIDRTYRLQCYEDAVDGLPPDLRDYTNASEVIERALQSAARRPTSARTPAAETSSTADRVLVALLVGMSLALLAAAALGILARRRGLGTTPPRR